MVSDKRITPPHLLKPFQVKSPPHLQLKFKIRIRDRNSTHTGNH